MNFADGCVYNKFRRYLQSERKFTYSRALIIYEKHKTDSFRSVENGSADGTPPPDVGAPSVRRIPFKTRDAHARSLCIVRIIIVIIRLSFPSFLVIT